MRTRGAFGALFAASRALVTGAAERWHDALAEWAIPDEILAQATQSPWEFPPGHFGAPEVPAASPSRERALDCLAAGGSVLDVGCGGGAAALALAPPAAHVTGVDSQASMLVAFLGEARRRGVDAQAIEGSWPDAARRAPTCDVVVCHHVVYNVGDVVPFVRALTDRARRRVVLELSARHPLANLSPAWEHFWGLARPESPTAADFLAVLSEMGVSAHSNEWRRPARSPASLAERARTARVRLCLPASRDGDVADFLSTHDGDSQRGTVTVWWDVTD
ncbi:MAG: methyltransferase domain-containing protein [Acidimicrobiales bacterium]